mgnify:CR=1 FL=1
MTILIETTACEHVQVTVSFGDGTSVVRTCLRSDLTDMPSNSEVSVSIPVLLRFLYKVSGANNPGQFKTWLTGREF